MRRWATAALILASSCAPGETFVRSPAASSNKYVFEIRLAEETPRADLFRVTDPATGETLYVRREPDLVGNDIARTRVITARDGGYAILVMFTRDGAKRLADLTAANTRKRVVFTLNGRPVSTPRIDEPITNGEAMINGTFTKEEAGQLARALVNAPIDGAGK